MNFDSHLIAHFKFSRAKLRFIAPLIAFVVAYGIILFKNDWNYSLYAGGYTLVLSLGVWIIYQLIHTKVGLRKTLAYLTFFVTSLLTITGNIGVLTGFNRSEGSM
jgi:alginate O-acetyltransferase complex protein AlgI